MAVAFDARMETGNAADGFSAQVSGGTTISSTGITVGSGATLLVVVAHFQSPLVSISSLSGTWNGDALTPVGQADHSFVVSCDTSAILVRANPTAGGNTLALSWTTAADCYLSAVSFTGSSVTPGFESTDTQTGTAGTTVTVPCAADDATVAVWGTNGSSPATNFTQIFSVSNLNPGAGASYALGSTSNAHTFTGAGGSQPAWVGAHVVAGAGPGVDFTFINPWMIAA